MSLARKMDIGAPSQCFHTSPSFFGMIRDSRITDNFPSLAAAVTESNATLHVGGHP